MPGRSKHILNGQEVGEATNALTGHLILRRIEIREKIRIQHDFLTWFSRCPLSERVGLCGSIALHGAFLHGRPSKDVDFRATIEDFLAFEHILEHSGFPWPYTREDILLFQRWRYVISEQRPGYRVALAIEFFQCNAPRQHRYAPVHLMEGRPIHLLVQPLEELVAHKMFFALSRSKSVDFIDIWMAFNTYPDIIPKVREIMHCGPRDIEGFTYSAYDLEKLLVNFERCESDWEENVRDCRISIPSYASVGRALETWLPQLAR